MTGETKPLVTLEPVDAVRIPTLMDNYTDALIANQGPATRAFAGGPPAPEMPVPIFETGRAREPMLAEHGFSALVTVTKGGRERTVLFDTGVTPRGFLENMRRLGLTPKDAEAVVLSHGHLDHTAGLSGLIDELGRPNLPVILHPEFWSRRRLAVPGQEPRELPTTSKSALLGAGFDVIEVRRPSFLLDRSVLITGEVDRTTDFETGFPIHQQLVGDEWVPDPLILDDQAVILHVRDKGLVDLTGCGHAGVINICRYARRLTGVERIYAVLGGFHLTGGLFEPIIPSVVQCFREMAPEVIIPAHCTGWRAVHALAAALPESFVQNSVGTRFAL